MLNVKTVRKMAGIGLTLLASVSLLACSSKDAKPEGQVVATVDGKEITSSELNEEISTLGPQAGQLPKRLVDALALARLVDRKMLTNEAEKIGLDKSQQFVLGLNRARETLLVQALQSSIVAKVPATPRESAQKYVSDNPMIFGDRKIITLDQIQFLRPVNADALQAGIRAAKSMEDVQRVLDDANIEYRRAPQQLDTLLVNPELSKEVLRLAASQSQEPFMFVDQPQGAPAPVFYINRVTDMRTRPFIGEEAIRYAQQQLQRQEITKRLQAELKKWQDGYKGKIVYGDGYNTPAAVGKQLEAEAKMNAGRADKPAGTAAPGTKPAKAAPTLKAK
jgi:EpsD family peptidyl-prolyl cis-trans isomerase